MSEIKVGDWVKVVKPMPCCGDISALGFIRQVSEIEEPYNPVDFEAGSICCICGAEAYGETALIGCRETEWFETVLLKKIPPLNELEDQTEERKVEV